MIKRSIQEEKKDNCKYICIQYQGENIQIQILVILNEEIDPNAIIIRDINNTTFSNGQIIQREYQ
jgi:hypothetical protein